jgi:DNA-directed RNA polymerase alpha subunit
MKTLNKRLTQFPRLAQSDEPVIYLSAYVSNLLMRSGIQSVNHLLQMTDPELFAIHGLGDKCLDEIDTALANAGYGI